jgi:hypothetical protein
LQEKIKTFDYSREDELEKSIQKYLWLKEWLQPT